MEVKEVLTYKPLDETRQKLGHKVINEYALVKLEKEKEFKPIFQPLKAAKRLSNIPIYAFDTENFGPGSEFSCGCIMGPGGYYFFTTSRGDLIAELDRIGSTGKGRKLLLAHNAAYDLGVIDYEEQSWQRHKTKENRLILATKDNFELNDTLNIIQGSVEDLGKTLGVPKLGDDSELLKRDQGKKWGALSDAQKAEWEEYNRRDVEIVLGGYTKFRQAFFDSYGIDITQSKTIASATMRAFRTKYLAATTDKLDGDDKLIQRGNIVNDMERMAYYGGRTEVFDLAYHPSTIYEDIVSSYPKRMLDNEFPHPCKFTRIKEGESMETLHKDFQVFIVKALVDIPEQHVGPLPVRVVEHADGSFMMWENPLNGITNDGTSVIFPSGGKVVSTWVSHELDNAVEKYGVKVLRIIDGIGYTHSLGKIYAPFITDAAEKKAKAASPIERQMAKSVMNHLYGKHAQMVINKYSALQNSHDELDAKKEAAGRNGSCEKVDIDQHGRAYRVVEIREADPLHVFPIWSVMITAFSRISLMNERLSMNGIDGRRVLYCDTDSCVYAGVPIESCIGKVIGEWDRQSEGKPARFFCKKGYLHDGKLKMKGVFPHKPRGDDLERIKEIISLVEQNRLTDEEGNPLTFRKSRPLKENEASRRGLKGSVWIEVNKKITTTMKGRHSDPTTGKTWTISCNEINSGVEYYEDKERKQSIATRPERNMASVVKRQHAEAPGEAGKREALQETVKARA